MRVIALNKHGVSSNFTACLHARKKPERFLPLIANVLFISIKFFVGKAFCCFLCLCQFKYTFEKRQMRNQGHICISGLKFDMPKVSSTCREF